MAETIGFIGLGNMGLPMCLNLVEAGFDVVALDLRAEPVAAPRPTPPQSRRRPTSSSPRSPAPTMSTA